MSRSKSTSDHPHSSKTLRRITLTHLCAVAVCVAFSLADRGLFFNKSLSRLFFQYGGIFFTLALLAWPLCPLMWIWLSITGRLSRRDMLWGGIAEGLLCLAQMLALLPAVS